MRILYITISFSNKNDNLYNNLVDALLRRGHSVTIVKSDSERNKTGFEIKTPIFSVLSVKTMDPFSEGLIKKGIGQITLETSFTRAIKKFLSKEKFDLILYATPPITLSKTILFCKEYYEAFSFLMLKDIFPQNAVDLNMIKKDGIIYRFFRRKEKKYYDISDYIGCMSRGNQEYVKKNNPQINVEKLHLFPNSINVDNSDKTTFNEDKTVFIFGGNLGKPQNISYLLQIIEELKDYGKAEFLIIGKGTEQFLLEEYIKYHKPDNLKYENYLPADEYENRLKSADVGLISLDRRFSIPNIPSKFQSYLKLKKPVLAITDTSTDLKNMIIDNDCGWWCDAEHKKIVIDTIKYICDNKEEQKRKGSNGYKYLIKEFDVEDNVDKIEKFIAEAKR